MKRNTICFLLISVILSLFLSGCRDRKEIDDLAYVIATGIDKDADGMIKITLQFAVPSKIAEGGKEGEESVIKTAKAHDIYTGIEMVNSMLSKEVNVSHSKIIVFSKELAEEGLDKYIREIIRGREFRPAMHFIVSESTAEEYIKNASPALEANPARYYELNKERYLYTGKSTGSTLYEFYIKANSPHIDPSVSISVIEYTEESENGEDDGNNGDNNDEKKKVSILKGVGIFSKDRLTGILDHQQTAYYLMAKGDLGNVYIPIHDRTDNNIFAVLNFHLHARPRIFVEIKDGKPYLDIRINLDGDIVSARGNIDYSLKDNIETLEKDSEEYIRENIIKLINQTKELGADILGFGRYARKYFITWEEWEEYDWPERFKEAVINADVTVTIERSGLIK